MKTCFRCSRDLPLSEFYRHPAMTDGHLGKCRDCTRRDVTEHRNRNVSRVRAYDCARYQRDKPKRRAAAHRVRRANPVKTAARTAVANAIRAGRLTRGPCEVCGTTVRVQAHHEDYSQPLVVQWLCFVHHRIAHGQLRELAATG